MNAPVDIAVNTKTVMAVLWFTLMVLFAYCDILSFYRPGQIQSMLDGKMGFLAATQGTLLVSSALMIVPALMALVNMLVPATVARNADIAVGVLYVAVSGANIVGETWRYYLLFGAVELIVTVLICVKALRWPCIVKSE